MLASTLREGQRVIVNAESAGQSGLQIIGSEIKRGAAMKIYRQLECTIKQLGDDTGSWSV